MKPEMSERLFIEDLFRQSVQEKKIEIEKIESIERLTGDASTRRYYRVFCTNSKYVVCLDNPSEQDNTFVKKQKFFFNNKIRVPQVYDTNPQKGYILEEDLGDVTLLQELVNIENSQEEYEQYKKVLDELISIHKINQTELNKSDLFEEKFDFDKLQSEIDFSLRYFLKCFLKIDDQKLLDSINVEFSHITKRLSEQNMVLTHRDFHSRNIMIKNKELITIDFQDARMGIPQYDLVSVLEDCYYEIELSNKNKLIDYYYEKLQDQLKDQGDRSTFMNLYDDMTLQRVFKAVGSFSYIFEHREDERYVKYIGFAMEKIKKILLKDPKYTNLRKLLFQVYYAS